MQVKTRVKAELKAATYNETQVQVKSQPKGGLKMKTNIKAGRIYHTTGSTDGVH